MHENMKPGVYEDETTGDIWRKTPDDKWTVNGQPWVSFPKVLTTLHKVISTPAVSISDATRPVKARYSDIIMSTNQEANEVLDGLTDILDKYPPATVSDLYDLVGLTSTYKDTKLGWSDINGTTIERTRNGYLLNLPAPKPL
jgi:hypothetical protein